MKVMFREMQLKTQSENNTSSFSFAGVIFCSDYPQNRLSFHYYSVLLLFFCSSSVVVYFIVEAKPLIHKH